MQKPLRPPLQLVSPFCLTHRDKEVGIISHVPENTANRPHITLLIITISIYKSHDHQVIREGGSGEGGREGGEREGGMMREEGGKGEREGGRDDEEGRGERKRAIATHHTSHCNIQVT